MKRVLVERNRYFDSVFLMRISHELEALPDVDRAIVSMGTPANLEQLTRVGFDLDPDSDPVLPQDLVVAVDAVTDAAFADVTARLGRLLEGSGDEPGGTAGEAVRPTSVGEAVAVDPDLNLALISVPGLYAAREARGALRHGLHVMLFSDNVSVDDEIDLKEEAISRGLLMMGPDCGTAIVNGSPLGFANRVRRGAVGIVGASGTGIQEISSIVHRLGGGVSQAIGTGGRDLSAAVRGRMTRAAIAMLGEDPTTEAIVVVSKRPEPEVASEVVSALRTAGKPAIVHFVAGEATAGGGDVIFTETLEDAAREACRALGIPAKHPTSVPSEPAAADGVANGDLRGLFCGGTLAQEAWAVLHRGGIAVASNVAADPGHRVAAGSEPQGHVIWDLGDDAFTVGVPHPMIEPALRDERVVRCGADPAVAVILADCVLGFGAHADPAGSLAEAVERAMSDAQADGRTLFAVASVTGTGDDPQGYDPQVERLRRAGVYVARSNAAACRAALAALRGTEGDSDG
jgi:succinyl-CoA synthetase alpha subunit